MAAPRKNLTTRMDALEGRLDTLIGLLADKAERELAQATIVSAPEKKAEVKSPAFGDRTFSEYVSARKAAALACEIHPALEVDGTVVVVCNRTFSPKSSGRTQHVARII